jgi:hypothetical protein
MTKGDQSQMQLGWNVLDAWWVILSWIKKISEDIREEQEIYNLNENIQQYKN